MIMRLQRTMVGTRHAGGAAGPTGAGSAGIESFQAQLTGPANDGPDHLNWAFQYLVIKAGTLIGASLILIVILSLHA
jgi:hypothetical protein